MRIVENISNRRLREIEKDLTSSLLKIKGKRRGDFPNRKKRIKIVLQLMKEMDKYGTYYVSNGSPQCSRFRRRSQGDIFRTVKYYYPDMTFKEFRALLFELVNTRRAYVSYCGTIKKRIFMRYSLSNEKPARLTDTRGFIFGNSYVDEFGVVLKLAVD